MLAGIAARVINQSPSDAVIAINKAAKIRTKKTSHGKRGEKLVLRTLRTDPEYRTVIHASLKNQRLGYDIRTINTNGEEEFREVKSSSKKTLILLLGILLEINTKQRLQMLRNIFLVCECIKY